MKNDEETNAIYGRKPIDLGLVGLTPVEMMFWLYCPIKLPHGRMDAPDNLKQFYPLVGRAAFDCDPQVWAESYVYVTAKTLYVTQEAPGNRRGWHSDGFMTDDLNYIWSDTKGTLFWEPERLVAFTQDHLSSLDEMEAACEPDTAHHRTYPDKHLLRLDQAVMHRVADFEAPGMRTFVKVSVSRHEYRLAGNSLNHRLAPDWEYSPRQESRNAPEGEAK